MTDAQDMELVRQFGRDNSEAAFTELVRRHINLVYSVARRCTRNDSDAQDVTQAVFITLARKAVTLREKTLLTGWLYETTRFTTTRLLRTNARRHAREQEAFMQSTLNETDKHFNFKELAGAN
jgi:RNA polymerase sigma factor (sigma-70 family)